MPFLYFIAKPKSIAFKENGLGRSKKRKFSGLRSLMMVTNLNTYEQYGISNSSK